MSGDRSAANSPTKGIVAGRLKNLHLKSNFWLEIVERLEVSIPHLASSEGTIL